MWGLERILALMNAGDRHAGDGADAPAGKPRRKPRVHVEMLRCDLGEVTDLSQTGMRVRTTRKPLLDSTPAEVTLKTPSHADEPVSLTARVVWAKRKGLTEHEIGFEFVDLTPEQAGGVMRLARDCINGESLRPRKVA
ncbi:MAG TPA: PilZ domain-containing protein [Phycisphaerales bacterium]|nr:PilZ domain-containing protein [Phycisphaerales bacterium]